MSNPSISESKPAQPHYQHDCESCVYLGSYTINPDWDGGSTTYDLYHCGNQYPTVIARYSSEGGDYLSGLIFAIKHPEHYPQLAEALRRAAALGLRVTDHIT